ncbi:MAG: dTMP kinase [Candidatus Eremiobacteraeota bacterium]|nr:dTMP kinase [Candidatus Eremiobacteraeota bacterium]MBV8354107.1 dTMP kinase [Candidatus Eremiobacteraeota bacterium]
MFITFEGIEGSGKSSLMEVVARGLRERGQEIVQAREPGGTGVGDAVRALFLDPNRSIEAAAEVMLLCASRAQLCVEVIRPALRTGKTVLCDRFYDSTIAYQGYGRALDIEALLQICLWATSGLSPDLTFVLDLSPEVSHERVSERAAREHDRVDRIEAESLDFHRRVREGYLQMAQRWPTRFVVLDATRDAEQLSRECAQAIEHVRARLRTAIR